MVRYRSIARGWSARRQRATPPSGRRQRISLDRQASVSVITALALPVCLGVMGLGIDVSQWATVRQQLQGIADLAALAGAGRYAYTLDSAQALSVASGVAEVNGLPVGAASTPTSGYSATIAFNSSPPQVTVTIQRQVSLSFARLLTSATTQAVSATAVAQVFQRTNGSQACVLGLQGFSNHQTSGTDLTFNGNTDTNMAGCDLRSDAGMLFNGNFSVNVPQIIASGTITANGSKLSCPTSGGCDAQLTGMPQIPDPFAGSYGSLLDAIPSGSSSLNFNGSGKASYSPGSYQSISFNGNGAVTFAPGVYYVSGNVTINGSTSVSGSGVTLIAGGSVTVNGNSTMNLTAPDSGTTAGLAIATGSTLTLNGDNNSTLVGALYAPGAGVTMNGNSSTNPGTCLVVVAQTVTINGNTSFNNSGCSALGVPPTYDLPGTTRLVQ